MPFDTLECLGASINSWNPVWKSLKSISIVQKMITAIPQDSSQEVPSRKNNYILNFIKCSHSNKFQPSLSPFRMFRPWAWAVSSFPRSSPWDPSVSAPRSLRPCCCRWRRTRRPAAPRAPWGAPAEGLWKNDGGTSLWFWEDLEDLGRIFMGFSWILHGKHQKWPVTGTGKVGENCWVLQRSQLGAKKKEYVFFLLVLNFSKMSCHVVLHSMHGGGQNTVFGVKWRKIRRHRCWISRWCTSRWRTSCNL